MSEERTCIFCKKQINVLEEVVELVGGFFQLHDEEFVMDADVWPIRHAHRLCLVVAVQNGKP